MQQEQQQSFFDKLMQELQRLCEEKLSGTLFVTTEENHAVRFVLKDGMITGITYRTKHGFTAIPLVKNITGGTYTFASNRVFQSYAESSAAPLPSTPEIFRLLGVNPAALAIPISSQPAIPSQPAVSRTAAAPIRPVASPTAPPAKPAIPSQPAVSRTAAAPIRPVASPTAPPAKKILVVEDSGVTRKLIAKTLVDGGYAVVEAENGMAAFARLNEENPDLMLLDIVMPGIDGYKVLSMVRKHDTFKNLPVIMLTSRDGLLDKLRGKMGGSDEYLTKPFTPEQLLEKINKHLSSR